jgi:FkbM family methyltransferase
MTPRSIKGLARDIGALNAIRVWAAQVMRLRPAADCYKIQAPGVRTPLFLRLSSSDSAVYQGIFLGREYACVEDAGHVGLVIDCGANVGYSSAYFLNRYPTCRVIAVEPDPGNFAMLTRNLAPYRDRVKLVQSGVWSHPVRLCMNEVPFRDGREWTRQVRECRPDEPADFTATDIGTLLRESGEERISILKIDVERAELEIFARNYDGWIHLVDNLLIELHDDECEAVFARAIAGVPFSISHSGELTVCKRS